LAANQRAFASAKMISVCSINEMAYLMAKSLRLAWQEAHRQVLGYFPHTGV
jgi:hypothetical protein